MSGLRQQHYRRGVGGAALEKDCNVLGVSRCIEVQIAHSSDTSRYVGAVGAIVRHGAHGVLNLCSSVVGAQVRDVCGVGAEVDNCYVGVAQNLKGTA